jgi:hypothetical protein
VEKGHIVIVHNRPSAGLLKPSLAFIRNYVCNLKRNLILSYEKFHEENPQSRQSAKRFPSRWNWDSPTPLAAGECAPPPFGPGGRALTLAAKGVGESQFQRGDIHCGALYI